MTRPGWARAAALILLLLLCQGMSMVWRRGMADSGGVTLYLSQAGGSYKALQKAEQRTAQPTAFAAWSQLDGQTAESAELNRTDMVSIVTVYGDSTLALPDLPMLLPGGTGCLLDSATGYSLFGDESPVGETINVGKDEYTIVGVFDFPSGMLVRQGGGESDTGWNRVTLAGSSDPTGAAEEFAMRHGLNTYAVLSSGVWQGAASVFSQLLPMLLLLTLILAGLRCAYGRREMPVQAGLIVLGTLAAVALLWFAFGLSVTIPASLVPARWSDFEFWTAALADLKAQLWQILTLPKELPQALPMNAALHCALWGGAAAALYLPCVKAARRGWGQILHIITKR